MSATRDPQQVCEICGAVEYVRPDGRGFPPDIAKRRLVKRCKAHGCACAPRYYAGLVIVERTSYREGGPQ